MNRAAPYTKPVAMGAAPAAAFAPAAMMPYGVGTAPVAFQTGSEDPSLEALQSRTLFFGRLPSDITDETIRQMCEEYGEIKKCIAYPAKNMAFVEFYDLRDAEKARTELRKHGKIGDKPFEVQYSSPKQKDKDGNTVSPNTGTLYVRPQGADRSFKDPNSLDSYKSLFAEHGDIKKVSVNRKREAEKFIEYFDSRHSLRAQETLNNYNFNGVVLEVQFAQQASRSLNRDTKAEMRRDRKIPDGCGPYRGHAGQQAWNGYGQAAYANVGGWSAYGGGRWGSGYANGAGGYGALAASYGQQPAGYQSDGSSMAYAQQAYSALPAGAANYGVAAASSPYASYGAPPAGYGASGGAYGAAPNGGGGYGAASTGANCYGSTQAAWGANPAATAAYTAQGGY